MMVNYHLVANQTDAIRRLCYVFICFPLHYSQLLVIITLLWDGVVVNTDLYFQKGECMTRSYNRCTRFNR